MNRYCLPFAFSFALGGLLLGCSNGEPAPGGPPRTRLLFSSNRSGQFHAYMLVLQTGELTQLTSGDEARRDAVINRTAGRFAYAGDSLVGPGENFDIYTMLADGSGVTQLTTDPGEDRSPSFNSANTHIAYMTNRNGNWDIYVTNLAGTSDQQVTSDPADDRDPTFSPDGMHIYFVSSRTGSFRLWRMNADGSDAEELAGSYGEPSSPFLGPDGKVYFAGVAFGQRQLYRLNLANGNVEKLTNSGENYDPRPLNDEFIAFTSNRTGEQEVFTLEIRNGLQQNRTNLAAQDVTR